MPRVPRPPERRADREGIPRSTSAGAGRALEDWLQAEQEIDSELSEDQGSDGYVSDRAKKKEGKVCS
jgi:hypothetical protein